MLRLTVGAEDYLMIGEDIKIVFLGGSKNHLRIMIDAPKEMNVVRSKVIENNVTDPEEKANLPHYYACLLYTSDAADDRISVDLGGRRIIKKIFFKQKTAYEMLRSLVGSEMCIRDSLIYR